MVEMTLQLAVMAHRQAGRKNKCPASISRPSSMRPRQEFGSGSEISTDCRAGIRRSATAGSKTANQPIKWAAYATSIYKNGDRIRERLLGLSDYDMFCTYSILESPMPLTEYVATMRLTPVTDGDRCLAEWTAEFECDEAEVEGLVNGIGTDVFLAGFSALKRQLPR